MMNNNGYGNFMNYPTGGYYGGMMYQDPSKKLTMTQGVGEEQLKSLRNTGGFSLELSQEELWKSYCTHRQTDRFTISQDDEGKFTCALCGTKFKPFEGTVNDARDLVDKVVDLMETAKMQSLTLPTKTIQEFFQIEPLLKRLPALYEQSCNDYKRAMGFDNNYIYGQENNAFAMYQNMINPMAGNGYYDPAMMNMNQGYGQPMMNQGYNQPMMNQQPVYGQPMMNQGYNQPMMNQQPMNNNGYQPYNNNMGQQPQPMNQGGNPFNSAPANPAPVGNTQSPQGNTGDTVTVTKVMTD